MPWYWPIWFVLFIFWLLVKLPYRWQLCLGKYLGLLIMRMANNAKRIANINLKLCFPELNDNEREKLLRASFINIGIAMFETGLGFWGSAQQLQSLATISGYEHVQKALNEKRGILVLGAHFTTLEIVGRIYSIDHAFSVMYRPHKIGIINLIIQKALNKYYEHAIPRHALRDMVKLFKQGKMIWYSADVNAGRKASVFAPFFGIQAATVKAVSRFAELTNCVVIPLAHYRRKDNSGYDIIFSPALENFPCGDYVADATRINQILEDAVRKCPEQYLWQYMRFKTRPLGEARLYKKD